MPQVGRAALDYLDVNTPRMRGRLAALALAVAVLPVATGTADAKPRHKTKRAKTTAVAKQRATTRPVAPVASPAPAPEATPAVTSVVSIGGYVFYNLTYAEAVEAYLATVAAAPAGYTPPPVTSISVTTTVGGTV